MSLDELDPLLTSVKRLACLGAVSVGKRVDFTFVRSTLGLSDSDLSKQLKPLVDAGYITSTKNGKGKTRRMWLEITELGQHALAAHSDALARLMSPVPGAVQAQGAVSDA